jgi:hypothetical protein
LSQKAFEVASIREAGITLPGKGWPVSGSLITKSLPRPSPEKSPLSMAEVGANRPVWLNGVSSVSRPPVT